jgi:hypothetical protein
VESEPQVMHYHGTPISPKAELLSLAGRNFCVSFARADDIKTCHEIGQSVMLDNGAYTAWKGKARRIMTWEKWARWVEPWLSYATTWAVLPDVIEGSEEENDELVERWRDLGNVVPVWHLHESFERLQRLAEEFSMVCFGSSAQYAEIGTHAWHAQVERAFDAIADDEGRVPWVHMLRGMGVIPLQRYPFASADSTDIGRNHNREQNTALSLAERWDCIQAPARWQPTWRQLELEVVT